MSAGEHESHSGLLIRIARVKSHSPVVVLLTCVLYVLCYVLVLVGICATIVLAHALIHTLPPLDDGAGDELSEFIGADEREAAGTQV